MVAVPTLDLLLVPLADALGFPVDQLRLAACLVLCIPTCTFLRAMRSMSLSRNILHFYSIVLGIWMSYYMYGLGTLTPIISSLIVYLAMKYLPTNFAYKFSAAFAFIFVFCCHIYRMLTDPYGWHMDFTSIQMLLTVRLMQFAFCVHDGTLPLTSLSSRQRKYRITKFPTLLEYYGWHFFLPAVIVLTFEYNAYMAYITNSPMPSKTQGQTTTHKETLIGWITSALSKLGVACLCIGSVVVLGGKYDVSEMEPYCNGDHSLMLKLWEIYAVAVKQRMRYYFAWYFSEALMDISGYGFSHKTGKWTRGNNVRMLTTEFGQNLHSCIDAWNKRVNKWLRFYAFERLPFSKSRNADITFLMSATWHGIYTGYFMAFVTIIFHRFTVQVARQRLRPQAMKNAVLKKVYDVLGIAASQLVLCYSLAPFLLLQASMALRVWNSTYWIVHTVCGVGALLVRAVVPLPPRKPSPSPANKSE
ncbi:Mboat2 protein [Pelomyxa schiedti]|nr:Mboat2 protein [Pelomyxa schiedti]